LGPDSEGNEDLYVSLLDDKGKWSKPMHLGENINSKGFEISQKRIQQDMGFQIDLVSATERASWISSRFNIDKTIYMGDGVLDYLVFSKVFYAIAPANALQVTKNEADFVTKNSGGERAVAEACLHIVNKFFNGFQAASGVNLNELKQILRMK
jgi:hypothetical protein